MSNKLIIFSLGSVIVLFGAIVLVVMILLTPFYAVLSTLYEGGA